MTDWSSSNRDGDLRNSDEEEADLPMKRSSGILDISNVEEQTHFVETPFTIAARRAATKRTLSKPDPRVSGGVTNPSHQEEKDSSNHPLKTRSIPSDSSSNFSTSTEVPLSSSNSSPGPQQKDPSEGKIKPSEAHTFNLKAGTSSPRKKDQSQEPPTAENSKSLSLTENKEEIERSYSSSKSKSKSKQKGHFSDGMKPANVRIGTASKGGQTKLSLAPCLPGTTLSSATKSFAAEESALLEWNESQATDKGRPNPPAAVDLNFKPSPSKLLSNSKGNQSHLEEKKRSSKSKSPCSEGEDLPVLPASPNPQASFFETPPGCNLRQHDRRHWRLKEEEGGIMDEYSSHRDSNSEMVKGNFVNRTAEEQVGDGRIEIDEIFAYGPPEVTSNFSRENQIDFEDQNQDLSQVNSDRDISQVNQPFQDPIHHYQDGGLEEPSFSETSPYQIPHTLESNDFITFEERAVQDFGNGSNVFTELDRQPTSNFDSYLADAISISKSPLYIKFSTRKTRTHSNTESNEDGSSASNTTSLPSRQQEQQISFPSRISLKKNRDVEKEKLACRMEIENEGIKLDEWGTLFMNSKTTNGIAALIRSNASSTGTGTGRAITNNKPFRSSLLLPGVQPQLNIPSTPIRSNFAASNHGKKFRLPLFSTPMQLNSDSARKRLIESNTNGFKTSSANRNGNGNENGSEVSLLKARDGNPRQGGSSPSDSRLFISEEKFYEHDNEIKIVSDAKKQTEKGISPPKKRTKLNLFEPTPLQNSASSVSSPSKTSKVSDSSQGLDKDRREVEQLTLFNDPHSKKSLPAIQESYTQRVSNSINSVKSTIDQFDSNAVSSMSNQISQSNSKDSIIDQSHNFTSEAINIPSVKLKPDVESTSKDWSRLFKRSKERFHLDCFSREIEIDEDNDDEDEDQSDDDDDDDDDEEEEEEEEEETIHVENTETETERSKRNEREVQCRNQFTDESNSNEIKGNRKKKEKEKIKKIDPYLIKAFRQIMKSNESLETSDLDQDQLRMKIGIEVIGKIEKMVENL